MTFPSTDSGRTSNIFTPAAKYAALVRRKQVLTGALTADKSEYDDQ